MTHTLLYVYLKGATILHDKTDMTIWLIYNKGKTQSYCRINIYYIFI